MKKGTLSGSFSTWQRALFTRAGLAIFAAEMLNFCVRDGYRCVHLAIATRSLRSFPQNQITVSINFRLSSSSCLAFQVIKSSTY